jgi:hypothetical protein
MNGFHRSVIIAVAAWLVIRILIPYSVSILFKLQDSTSFSLLKLYPFEVLAAVYCDTALMPATELACLRLTVK